MQSLKAQILEILSEDCRTPLERIAVMTGSDLTQVTEAVEELERDRVILQYSPIINWDRTDKERVEALIEVKVTPQRDMGFDAIAGRIYRFDEVKSVFLMSGSYDPQRAGAVRVRKAQPPGIRHRHLHQLCAQAL